VKGLDRQSAKAAKERGVSARVDERRERSHGISHADSASVERTTGRESSCWFNAQRTMRPADHSRFTANHGGPQETECAWSEAAAHVSARTALVQFNEFGPSGLEFGSAEGKMDPGGPILLELKEPQTPGVRSCFSSRNPRPLGFDPASAEGTSTPPFSKSPSNEPEWGPMTTISA
jgi:hypothetical protein